MDVREKRLDLDIPIEGNEMRCEKGPKVDVTEMRRTGVGKMSLVDDEV